MFHISVCILEVKQQDILWYENYDLEHIITPVKHKVLGKMLKQAGYNKKKTRYLVNGFKNGFSLHYEGLRKNLQMTSRNLPITVGSEIELWNKVMKEVKLKRYTGPFEKPPFESYIQSPIGLVPKDNGKDTRLIFHLSHPRDGNLVNAMIPEKYCSVVYPDFQEAVELCRKAGKFTFLSKSDMKSAFRNVPLKLVEFSILVMKATNPKDGKTYWFCDKCLPFGSSVSCKIFQDFSDAIAFLVRHKTRHNNVNYLDDFLFIALLKALCDEQVDCFIDLCKEINFPVALEKTVWGTQIIVFLGLLIDTVNQVICIPKDKVDSAVEMIQRMLDSKKKKVTVLNIQRLTGYLNFLCKCVVPGRAFTMRLYSLTSSKLKQHHHVKLPTDVIQDLTMWLQFLKSPQVYFRPFMDFGEWTAEDIVMFSDASKSLKRGFGAYCQNDWMAHSWKECGNYIEEYNPSIDYLELYAVTAAVITWISRFANRRICLFCDNEFAV